MVFSITAVTVSHLHYNMLIFYLLLPKILTSKVDFGQSACQVTQCALVNISNIFDFKVISIRMS